MKVALDLPTLSNKGFSWYDMIEGLMPYDIANLGLLIKSKWTEEWGFDEEASIGWDLTISN